MFKPLTNTKLKVGSYIYISIKEKDQVKSHNVKQNECTGKHKIQEIERFKNGQVWVHITNSKTREDWVLEMRITDKEDFHFYPLCNEKNIEINPYYTMECILHPCNVGSWTDEENEVFFENFDLDLNNDNNLSILKKLFFTRNISQLQSKIKQVRRKKIPSKLNSRINKRKNKKRKFPIIPEIPEIPPKFRFFRIY